jgi:hypothetical protein
MWGNVYGKKLFLPDNIGRIAAQIPASANLTAERFISDTTIFPLLKPFLPKAKATALWNDMANGNESIYNGIGFSRVFTNVQRYLRYCVHCVCDDATKYGESYWHRLHQFPGIYVCHKHGIVLTESEIDIADVRDDYYPLLPTASGTQLHFKPDCGERLLAVASDLDWIIQNSDRTRYYGDTLECYDRWLRVYGYRDHKGKTTHKKLAEALVDYYGQEFLSMFDAHNSGACSWTRKITTPIESMLHPAVHSLFMRFLAGSANEFFSKGAELKIPEYLPFGEPPYPCRNYLCEYHLQDVITEIEVVKIHATPHASFACPYCGFTYRRKGNIPKDKHYSGQIHIESYGFMWEEKVSELLSESVSPYKIARDFYCDVRTILDFAVERKLLPPERLIKRPKYIPADNPQERSNFAAQRELYRTRWLKAIAENPNITRNELRLLDSKAEQWLHLNDADWYEEHSPPSQKHHPKWDDNDDSYAERIENAMNRIRDDPGKPKWISIAAIGKLIGDGKIHRKLASDRFPKSRALIGSRTETLEDWQRRKIIWAVQDMRNRGEIITVFKVRHHATIEDKERKWDEFIAQCIINSE